MQFTIKKDVTFCRLHIFFRLFFKTQHGLAWLGLAQFGLAWLSSAWLGLAQLGSAWNFAQMEKNGPKYHILYEG